LQESNAGPEANDSLEHAVANIDKTSEAFDGVGDADGEGNVGPAEGGIAGAGFTAFSGGVEHVFEVVDDLIAETPADGNSLEELQLSGGSSAEYAGQNESETDERNSFTHGDAFGGLLVVAERGVIEVHALAVEEAADAEILLEVGHRILLTILFAAGLCAAGLCAAGLFAAGDGSPGEGVGLVDEGECGENCMGLTKLKMSAGLSAALLGIVHAGEVVKEQRGGMEVLQRDAEFGGIGIGQGIGSEHLSDDFGSDEAAGIAEHMLERGFEMRLSISGKREVVR